MPDLRLDVPEFTSAAEWRWKLTDTATGALLADHRVRLDQSSAQFDAFTDLDFYASWHAAPDRRADDETRIATELGDWIGAEVLGPAITGALAQARKRGHVTVRVTLPEGAEELAHRPLELARIDGKPLAQRDVTLIMAPAGIDAAMAKPPGERLRVLGLFSLPEGGHPANLRQGRHALVTLIREIEAAGRAADIEVLQYGVTRARLRDALEDGEGWDIIHISGHGAPGELLLETGQGRPDLITAAGLAELLDRARERVKLVTIAACQSAAQTAAEQRRILQLPSQRHDSPERTTATPDLPPSSLATELASALGCAVLAMRFPVTDEFATALTVKLYDLLAAKGRTLPSALAIALGQLSESDSAHPVLSLAAPALFGASAAGLTLKAPDRTAHRTYGTSDLKMAGFPPAPDRFVGRTGVMARASAALASGSGISGILLHGMPGGGKTACALELAYTHEHAFDRLVWYKAPDEGMEISGALTDFALTLERCLDGFQMAHLVSDSGKLAGFLPRLTELLERNRLLIVLDNAESLLTASGQWRDDRWGQVIAALTAHHGLGRLIMTTRRVPAIASGVSAETPDAIARESVDALSPDEALLLARELPNLRRLISAGLPGIDAEAARKLAVGILSTAQGHPKLLELADGQAAHPEQLATLIEAGDQAWRDQGGLPENFFSGGSAPAAPGDYVSVLAAWTDAVTDTLSSSERDLFWFLCCLEEPDRIHPVVTAIWPHLWRELGRNGDPPVLDRALASVTASGLVALLPTASDEIKSYGIHPGVAAAGRDHAGHDFQNAVDTKAAEYWEAMYRYARGETGDATVNTVLLVRAGLATARYLTRLRRWDHAAGLLHNAFIYDPSRANAATMLPAIEHIARHDPRQARFLPRILLVLDPAAGEAQLRAVIDKAAARGEYEEAALAASQLADLCLDSGRLTDALTLNGQQADYTRQAGLGPWTQLHCEVQRLYVLASMGHARHVLDEVHRLRDYMETLPGVAGAGESARHWSVRESLFNTGGYAAILLGRWQDALDLNSAQIASMRGRRTPAAGIAKARFSDHGPLIRLGRTDEALDLLQDCRQVFESARDAAMLGKTLGALATIEEERGHGDNAIRLLCDALRYQFLAGDVTTMTGSYHNLAICVGRARRPAYAFAIALTAALIRTFTGIGGSGPSSLDGAVHIAALVLRDFGAAAEPPADVADLCRRIGDIPGTDPAGLIAQLSPDPETAERTLRDLIAQAQALAQESPDSGQE